MSAILNLLILGGLLLVFVQDIKNRAVYWIIFPVLALLFYFSQTYLTNNLIAAWQSVALNVSFIALQLLALTAWFSVKNKRLVNITNGLLGWGDVLFITSVAFYLPLPNFVIFYIGSLFLSLLIWGSYQAITVKKNAHIPLAGLQALLLAILLITGWLNPDVSLNNDSWIVAFYI